MRLIGIHQKKNRDSTQDDIPTLGAVLFALTLLMVCYPTLAQQSSEGTVKIEPGGRLWITGSASVVDYSCEAEQLSGRGSIRNVQNPTQNIQNPNGVSFSVSIPVHSLKCGKEKMNEDMYEAMKVDDFPDIEYKLLQAAQVDSASGDNEGWIPIKTKGIMRIAGQSDTTNVLVKGRLLDERQFRLKGEKEISMKTYDIKPPSRFLGLIKADEQLTVHFDVTVRLRE